MSERVRERQQNHLGRLLTVVYQKVLYKTIAAVRLWHASQIRTANRIQFILNTIFFFFFRIYLVSIEFNVCNVASANNVKYMSVWLHPSPRTSRLADIFSSWVSSSRRFDHNYRQSAFFVPTITSYLYMSNDFYFHFLFLLCRKLRTRHDLFDVCECLMLQDIRHKDTISHNFWSYCNHKSIEQDDMIVFPSYDTDQRFSTFLPTRPPCV